jgi:hypothetical protein
MSPLRWDDRQIAFLQHILNVPEEEVEKFRGF